MIENFDVPDWYERAECLGTDNEVFFPIEGSGGVLESRERERIAKQICTRCEVQVECLAFALETSQSYGVWGGITFSRGGGSVRSQLRRRAKIDEGERAV